MEDLGSVFNWHRGKRLLLKYRWDLRMKKAEVEFGIGLYLAGFETHLV